MTTCVLTPYELAFGEDADIVMICIETVINLCFLVDIVINFTSAFYDDEYNLIDDHRVKIYFFQRLDYRQGVS